MASKNTKPEAVASGQSELCLLAGGDTIQDPHTYICWIIGFIEKRDTAMKIL
jgi:hypothetical protein